MRYRQATSTLLAGVLISIGFAAAADAQTNTRYKFTFSGRGYGHGIGMSQYGAQGAAKAGMRAEAIVGMYFPGTTLQKLPNTTVRVLLASSLSSASLTSSGGWRATTTDGVIKVLPAGPLSVSVKDTTMTFRNGAGTIVHRAVGTTFVAPSSGALLSLGSRRYRGQMKLSAAGSRLTVINVVNLESYLRGVVPLEMPASWHPEALRAQVIAARSYGMATKRSGEFDMYADERSQMYGGVAAEDSRTNTAVVTSAGLVATYGGRVATTFFSSTSGGKTEAVQYAWGGSSVPYLVSVDDAAYDVISPRHVWGSADRKVLRDSQISAALGLPKPVVYMRVVKRSPSGRALQVRVVQSDGKVTFHSASTFRFKFGLPSTWFYQRRSVL